MLLKFLRPFYKYDARFATTTYARRTNNTILYIENEKIQSADNLKQLCDIIDKNQSWNKQIDAVCANITRRTILLKLL